MKTFIFPGQGSQQKGMGRTLFDEFKELSRTADEILGYSIKELCLEDPNNKLNQTQFTQPAIYVVNALSYYKKIKESNQKPNFVAGHSLGEYNALLSAECFDFETGLKLVKKRGELMSQAIGGGMAAILNASKEKIETILKANGLFNIDLANYNTLSQIVISGLKDEIKRAHSCFQMEGIAFIPLKTSGAFHSRYMHSSKEKFIAFLKNFKFSDLKIPVISNRTANPYKNDEIMMNLSYQIISPVKWCESIQYLMKLGNMEFEEVGNGNVLTKLVQKIQKETTGILNNEKQKIETKKVQVDKINAHTEKGVWSFSAEDKVKAWNKNNPIGTKVKSMATEDSNLETRTEAVVLFGHRAAVYMKGYNGYFDLDEITELH